MKDWNPTDIPEPKPISAMKELCAEFDTIQRWAIEKFFEKAKTAAHRDACITIARKTGFADLADKLEIKLKQ